MLGSFAARYIPCAPGGAEITLTALDYPEIDITSPESVAEAFDSVRPDIVLNCAAYTDVDGAETHEMDALAVNAVGPELLAHAAKKSNALLVHVSTDFVFDGEKVGAYREDDEVNPLGVYGKSKLLGERAVASIAPEYLIVRTAWLYGPDGGNFVATILNLARQRSLVRVVDDQRGSPTYTGMLAETIWPLVSRGARGVFHASGRGACTWYELAAAAVELAGVKADVQPCTREEFPRPAKRPKNSVLDCSKAEDLLGEELEGWRVGLETYITGLSESG